MVVYQNMQWPTTSAHTLKSVSKNIGISFVNRDTNHMVKTQPKFVKSYVVSICDFTLSVTFKYILIFYMAFHIIVGSYIKE